MFFGLGFEPDGVAMGEQVVVGLFFGDDAAADGDDGAIAFTENALESALLNGAIAGLPIEGKNFGKGHAGIFFDFVVQFDEGGVAFVGEFGTERGFARATQADESDAAEAQIVFRAEVAHQASGGLFETMAGEALDEAQEGLFLRGVLVVVLIGRREQLFERNAEDDRDSVEEQYGDVAFAGFELGKVAFGDIGFACESFAGHGAAVAKIADPGGEEEKELRTRKLRIVVERELGFDRGVRCHE